MEWTGKNYRILFDDKGMVMSKVGRIIEHDPVFVKIKTSRGEELIPVGLIIRMEATDE